MKSTKSRVRTSILFAAAALLIILILITLSPLQSILSLRVVEDGSLYMMQHNGTTPLTAILDFLYGPTDASSIPVPVMPIFGTSFAGLNPDGDTIVGHNLDVFSGNGLILASNDPAHYASISIVDLESLGIEGEPDTFFERLQLLQATNFPQGGMNEHGLTVAALTAPCRLAHQTESIHTLFPSELVRHLLNTAADVDEALRIAEDSTIRFNGMCTHFLFADTTGRSVIVEYIDGDVVVTESRDPWQVTTNFLVAEWQPVGADAPCWRYIRAFEHLQALNGELSSAEAMTILEDVDAGSGWSAVYNPTRGELLLALGMDLEHLHAFQLGEPRQSPHTPRQRIAQLHQP